MSDLKVHDLDDEGIKPKKKQASKKKTVDLQEPKGSLKDRLNKLLENVPAQDNDSTYNRCILPSSREIFIRSAYFEDEREALTLARAEKIPYIEALTKIVTKGINYSELPFFDHVYILLKVREYSFGSSYPITVNCDSCDAENELVVDINNLRVDRCPTPMTSLEVTVDLPIAKKKVVARIPRITESDKLGNNFLHTYIISVDNETDKYVLEAFIKALPVKDTETIKNAINPDYGVDPTVNFNCISCKNLNTILLPIDSNFFTLS